MKGLEKILKGIGYGLVIGLAVTSSSCGRIASLPWKAFGTCFPNPLKLGQHCSSEKNGQVYTCKAGPVDTAHARIVADRTNKLQKKFDDSVINGKTSISLKIDQPPKYSIKIDYPNDWDRLSDKRKETVAKEVSIEMGAYFAYVDSVWHEVWTWHGGRSVFFHSEFASAFSCEDNVSNALGAYVAKVALRSGNKNFNQAVTKALDMELERLVVLPCDVAEKLANNAKGKRNFDTGLYNGIIKPWYIEGISECGGKKVEDYFVPNLKKLGQYGFLVDWNMRPGSRAGKKAVKRLEGENKRIGLPELNKIIYRVRESAIKKYGFKIDEHCHINN